MRIRPERLRTTWTVLAQFPVADFARACSARPSHSVRKVERQPLMNRALEARAADVNDLSSTLHLLADAADRRDDADSRGALRLVARFAENIAAQAEELISVGENASQ